MNSKNDVVFALRSSPRYLSQEDQKPLKKPPLIRSAPDSKVLLQNCHSEPKFPMIKSPLPSCPNFQKPHSGRNSRGSSLEGKVEKKNPVQESNPKQYSKNSVTRVVYKTKVGSVLGKPKVNNQDSFIIKPLLNNIRGNYLFSVLDGHGTYGHTVSRFIRDYYPDILQDSLERDLNPLTIEKNIYQSINKLNKELAESGIEIAFSGSTFVSVLLFGQVCVCANIGDSRAVLARYTDETWESYTLSQDHNTKRYDERTRILNCNGRIEQAKSQEGELVGPERIWLKDEDYPGLSMTRSIGDKIAKAVGVTSDPEVMIRRLSPDDRFIILASDGVWEHIDSQEAVDIISEYWEEARDDSAQALVNEAYKRWDKNEYVDDITAVIIFLSVNS